MAKQGAVKGTYVNAKELEQIEELAARAGITVSAWIKQAIIEKIVRS